MARLGMQKLEPLNIASLIARAADVRTEIDRLGTLDGSLSAKAYLRAVEEMPGCSATQADAIEKALRLGRRKDRSLRALFVAFSWR
jgi:hypothetical protein